VDVVCNLSEDEIMVGQIAYTNKTISQCSFSLQPNF